VIVAPLALRSFGELRDSFRDQSKQMLEQVAAYAAEHEQLECAPEALRRAAACAGLLCTVQAPAFAHKCLELARNSPSLCTEVPTTLLGAAFWPASRCTGKDANDELCRRVFMEVLKTCVRRSADPHRS
jgi:hypothetical protein